MTRALPRTNFHSSKLIRCLADLDVVEAFDAGDAFAEKLSHWIHFADGITLSAVHNAPSANLPAMPASTQDAVHAAAETELNRVQAMLVNSITKSCSPNPGTARIKLPTPPQELPLDLKAAYAPYGWFYAAHQREMEASTALLRSQVRAVLAKASPRLRKLAELDATLEKILAERESKLLSKVPVLLKIRFEQLFKAHQQRLADTGQADEPARWTQAGGWLARFCSDMQMLLLAELELRLQPAMGLIEAFDHKTSNE